MMSDIKDEIGTDQAVIEPASDWEVLAGSLPEKGIARALLKAWTEGDSAERVQRLLEVAQPAQGIVEAVSDTSQD